MWNETSEIWQKLPYKVLPFGQFFPDYVLDADIFQEIGMEMVKTKKNAGFDKKVKNECWKLVFFTMNSTIKYLFGQAEKVENFLRSMVKVWF